jgi:hypothetical protein
VRSFDAVVMEVEGGQRGNAQASVHAPKLVHYCTRTGVSIAELWYRADAADIHQDLVRYVGLEQPIDGAWRTEEFWTIWIDLRTAHDDLFANMHRTTRLEIRRAADYRFDYNHWYRDAGAHVEEFADFYDRFAEAKQLRPVDRIWLRSHVAAGTLDLSCVTNSDGRSLAWHAHYRDLAHAQVVMSASCFRDSHRSAFRRMVSRAHRYLHWQDIQRFQRSGLSVYDLGGWYSGRTNQDLLRVNEFKEGFGGALVKTFNCVRPFTWTGALHLRFVSARERLFRGCVGVLNAFSQSGPRVRG